MKNSRFNEWQITVALKQAEPDTKDEDVRRQMGVSRTILFRWKQL